AWLCRAASYLRVTKIAKGERRDKRKRSFLAWLCRAASYLRISKDRYKKQKPYLFHSKIKEDKHRQRYADFPSLPFCQFSSPENRLFEGIRVLARL
uniref:hypothetical protein n=2 Tax=Paraprevotella clara TaxID=454154 RepID=UPI003FF13753